MGRPARGSRAAARCAAPRHDRGDLQGRRRRVGPGPERRAGRRVGHGQREGQPAVGQRDRRQPVRQLDRPVRRRGAHVGEHLERVQRPARLARARAQVGLQPPAVAAVGIAVPVDGRQDGVDVAVPEQQVEAAPVQHAGGTGEEVGGGGQVDGHAPPCRTPPTNRPSTARGAGIAPAGSRRDDEATRRDRPGRWPPMSPRRVPAGPDRGGQARWPRDAAGRRRPGRSWSTDVVGRRPRAGPQARREHVGPARSRRACLAPSARAKRRIVLACRDAPPGDGVRRHPPAGHGRLPDRRPHGQHQLAGDVSLASRSPCPTPDHPHYPTAMATP